MTYDLHGIPNRNYLIACWLILAIALGLRLWGIDYGLPFIYWTDEYHEVMRAMELGSGGFNWARTGKGGFYLLLFLEYGVYFVMLKLSGAIASIGEFAELFVRDPSVFYLMGRWTAVAFGCATVAMAIVIGRLGYRSGTGLLAGLILAVNVVHVDLSHRVGVDIPMTLFAALALYFGLRIAGGGSRRDYVLAAVCAGLATTTKLPGILVLLPLLIAHGYRVGLERRGERRWLGSPSLWLALALFMLVWVGTNPGILFANDYLSLFTGSPSEAVEEATNASAQPVLWIYYLDVIRGSMGWPLFVVALLSAAYAAFRRTPADILLLAYAIANYVAISSTSSEYLYFPRYTLPIIFVLSVLAARAVSDVAQRLPRGRMAFGSLAIAALAAWPLAESVDNARLLTRTDTRTLAKTWFDTHVPARSQVLIEGGKISASRLSVPLEDSLESIDHRIEHWKKIEPRQARYLQMKRAVHDGGGYELELVKISSIAQLADYRRKGVEYFVIRPEYFDGSRKAKGSSERFLGELRASPDVELVARFGGVAEKRPGPMVEIYRVRLRAVQGP